MSPPDRADLADDLAYVRSLAEEGAHAPLVAGRYYVLWGTLMGAASAFCYLGAMDVIALPSIGYIAPWIIAGLTGWVVSLTLARRVYTKPGAATLGNRTASAVWLSVGVFMTLFWIALMVVHDNYQAVDVPPYFLFSLMFPVGFGVYGVAFFATATAARATWLRRFAYLSWAFAALGMFLLVSPHLWLAGAAGMALCAVLPGVLLMRQEPSETV